MDLFSGFSIQLAGFYILYSTSARAVFAKRKHNTFFYKRPHFSKAVGGLMLLGSTILFVIPLGITVGLLFSLLSLMTVSGFTIMLLPLRNGHTTPH